MEARAAVEFLVTKKVGMLPHNTSLLEGLGFRV